LNLKNILIIFLTIVFSCKSINYKGPSKIEINENKVISQTAQQLKKEKNLIPTGFGGSTLEGKEYLSISFQYFYPLSINEARELIIHSVQTFLKNLNKNKELQNLLNKPYATKNIEIIIFCYMPDYSNPLPPKLGVVDFRKDIISYKYNKEQFEKIYEETYEEALEKL